MREKRLVDANHFEQVLKNIACALKGELTYGKIKIDVVKLIMGSLEANQDRPGRRGERNLRVHV